MGVVVVCGTCPQQRHAGSKTLHEQSPKILNWMSWLMQVDLLMAIKRW